MVVDLSGFGLAAPVFTFLFVFVVIYALLAKTKIIGDSKFVHLVMGFIIASVFIAFSSLELFVRTLIPWFIVLVVVLFFVLIIVGFATKDMHKFLGNKFAWIFIIFLAIVFLISALYVFNPIFHPTLGLSPGEGESIVSQIRDWISSSSAGGFIALVVIAGIVAWVITKK
jgi:hypothetical protein